MEESVAIPGPADSKDDQSDDRSQRTETEGQNGGTVVWNETNDSGIDGSTQNKETEEDSESTNTEESEVEEETEKVLQIHAIFEQVKALGIRNYDDDCDSELAVKGAFTLLKKHDDLLEESEDLVKNVDACWKEIHASKENGGLILESTTEFLKKIKDLLQDDDVDEEETLKVRMDFLARIGFVNLTWTVYEMALEELNHSCVSEMTIAKKSNDKPKKAFAKKALKRVRFIWMCATDLSETFAKLLEEVGALEKLAEELDFMYKSKGMASERKKVILISLKICHNCTQWEDLRWNVKNMEVSPTKTAVELFHEFLSCDDVDLKLPALLILAHIIEDDDVEILTTDADINVLLTNIKQASESDSNRDENGYKLQALLVGLQRLAQREDKKTLMETDVVNEVLILILINGKNEEKAIACDIVWELSFDEDVATTLKKNEFLMKMLQVLEKNKDDHISGNARGAALALSMFADDDDAASETSAPDADVNTEKRASVHTLHVSNGVTKVPQQQTKPSGFGCLFFPRCSAAVGDVVEHKEQAPRQEHAPPSETTEVKIPDGHIMISYSHKNKEIVTKIWKELEKRHYKVWIDQKDLKGNIIDNLGEAIDNSAVVLLCQSQSYMDSTNCKFEARYANTEEKEIIPLQMQKAFKPRKWLGFILGGRKYYNFSDFSKYPFDAMFDELVQEIDGLKVPVQRI